MVLKTLLGAIAALALILVPAPAEAALPDPVALGVAVEVSNIDRVRGWLDEGLDPNIEADRVGTGLMIAAWEGNIPMMELFLSRGADIHKVNRHGEQALQLAAWGGKVAAVGWLLDRGAAVNRDGNAWSALHYAVFAGHGEIVRLLMERGADVNARAPNETTVLMVAAREGKEGLAKALLEAGADPGLTNDRGDTALAWAMRHGNLRIARLVAAAGKSAEAVKTSPESFGEAARSNPVPPEITQLLKRIAEAETTGQPTEPLRKALLQAIQRFRMEANSPDMKQAKASRGPMLVITASRTGRGERAEMVPGDAKPAESAAATPASLTWNYPESRLVDLTELMRQLDEAEKAGRPKAEVAKLRSAVQEAYRRLKGN